MKWTCLECENPPVVKSVGFKEYQDFSGCNDGISPTETTVECFECPICSTEYIELWDELEYS